MAMGSEHYTFCTMRKNNYEEALFKIEDEKFDIDTKALKVKFALKLVENCENLQDEGEILETLKKIDRLKVLKKTDFVGESRETLLLVKAKLLEKVILLRKIVFFAE